MFAKQTLQKLLVAAEGKWKQVNVALDQALEQVQKFLYPGEGSAEDAADTNEESTDFGCVEDFQYLHP